MLETPTENLRLRYSRPGAADEHRHNVEVKLPGPFEFEGREWFAASVEDDGFILCTEHERTFNVLVDDSACFYRGPRPETGEVITLDSGSHVRVSRVALAHHDTQRGSLWTEGIAAGRVFICELCPQVSSVNASGWTVRRADDAEELGRGELVFHCPECARRGASLA